MGSYSIDAIKEIADWLKQSNPDIITLQEAQGDGGSNQVKEIAQLLGYYYYFFDATSESHIDEGKQLGNGILSKHPITNHHNGNFHNPNIRSVFQDRLFISHDKGYGSCTIDINGTQIDVTTLHLLPFRAFTIELSSPTGQEILDSVVSELSSDAVYRLIQGDFNIDNPVIKSIVPNLFDSQLDEIELDAPTTPSGKYYDHVIFKGLKLQDVSINSSVKTDHYPVTCVFQLT